MKPLRAMAQAKQTWEEYFDEDPNGKGIPNAERLTLHAPVLVRPFAHKHADDPIADIVIGAPASGKSTFVNSRSKDEFFTVNPDDAKEHIPEYLRDKTRADLVHEESSWVAKQQRLICIARRQPVLFDLVGSDTAKIRTLIDELIAKRFHIRLTCVHVLDFTELEDRLIYPPSSTGRAGWFSTASIGCLLRTSSGGLGAKRGRPSPSTSTGRRPSYLRPGSGYGCPRLRSDAR